MMAKQYEPCSTCSVCDCGHACTCLVVLDEVEVLQCEQDVVRLHAGQLSHLVDGDGLGVGAQQLYWEMILSDNVMI